MSLLASRAGRGDGREEKSMNKTGKQILSSVGCYQIESLGPNIIERIKGDYFNVMGLPLFNLLDYLYSNK